MSSAATNEAAIATQLQAIESQVSGALRGFDFRLKVDLRRQTAEEVLQSTERIRFKMAEDIAKGRYPNAAAAEADYGDAVRFTYVFEPGDLARGAQETLDELARRFEAVSFKNTYGGPDIQYIITKWRDRETGQLFEVQFHTPDSFELAHGASHDWYEISRDTAQAGEYRDYALRAYTDLWQPFRAAIPPGAQAVALHLGAV